MVGCDLPFILDELGEVLEILTVCVINSAQEERYCLDASHCIASL
jgi:hypothetical protein